MVRRLTPEEGAEMRQRVEAGEAIVCYSRCLVCGRRTPHELCSEHEDHTKWPRNLDSVWGTGYDQEPETCNKTGCKLCFR